MNVEVSSKMTAMAEIVSLLDAPQSFSKPDEITAFEFAFRTHLFIGKGSIGMSMTSKSTKSESHIEPIEITKAIPKRGKITGAIDLVVEEPTDTVEVFFLAADQVEKIPANSAITFKYKSAGAGNLWRQANFFNDGEIKGPLVFCKSEIMKPSEILPRMEDSEGSILAHFALWISVIAVICALGSTFTEGPSWIATITTLVFTFTGTLALAYFLQNKSHWKNEQTMLRRIEALNSKKTSYITLPDGFEP